MLCYGNLLYVLFKGSSRDNQRTSNVLNSLTVLYVMENWHMDHEHCSSVKGSPRGTEEPIRVL